MKKKLSIGDIGVIKKPERIEPTPTKKKNPRGRPSERTPYVQLNTRVKLDTSKKIDELVVSKGLTMREIIEIAIDDMHNK